MSSSLRLIAVLSIGSLLAACGGSGGGSSPSTGNQPPPVAKNQSPGGIWTTQYTVTSGPNAGDTIKGTAIVDESGNLYFATRNQNNGCTGVGFGQATVNGNAISGNINVAIATYATLPGVNTACTYPDGSTSGTGTISGTVVERSSMTITENGTTSAGTALGSETDNWTFSSLYNSGSSLSAVTANYTDGSDTLSISSDGSIFEQDPATGCVINGRISILNSQYNAYSFSIDIANCTGTAAAANGLTMAGLAALDTTVSPAQLVFGASGNINGHFLVLVDSIVKQ